MREADLHTILRLPAGIFYSAGVKTNVLFFTKRNETALNSERLWVYDARSGVSPFGKRNALPDSFFSEFEKCYGEDPNGRDRTTVAETDRLRWRVFSREEIAQRGDDLDITWLGEEAPWIVPDRSDLEDAASETAVYLRMALEDIESLAAMFSSLPMETEGMKDV
jgi:type I restriction enzyme M protein